MPTVGVSPGTFTLQLGAPVCPPDEWGTGEWGVPRRGWYDVPNNWYGYTPGQTVTPEMTKGWLDPYGTDSRLMGLRDAPPTIAGLRLDILGVVVGVVAIAALGIGFVASR